MKRSYQLSAISHQPGGTRGHARGASALRSPLISPLAPRPSPLSSAFTLIELMVVVSIMGLLLAIAIPVSTAVMKTSQSKATQITMETVKSAIDVFITRKPLRNLQGQFESGGGSCWSLFNALPPSPTAQLSYVYPPSAYTPDLAASSPDDPRTATKFANPMLTPTTIPGILDRYLNSDPTVPRYVYAKVGSPGLPEATAVEARATDPSIECLVFFLRNYCPESRAILDKLGKALTNEDGDFVRDTLAATPQSARYDDLFEIRDAWSHTIQYNVLANRIVGGYRFRWELRSAGADGEFMDWFTDPENGDDVVVSGSLRAE